MLRFKIRVALVALTAIAAFALPASALATNVTRWDVEQQNEASPDGQAPYAGVPTRLDDAYREANMTLPTGVKLREPESLSYGHETFGVDLTWSPPIYGKPNLTWEFIRPPGRYLTQQIAASENVALYNTVNHQYLAWACPGFATACLGAEIEPFGINLAFSRTPEYQWRIFKGSDDGHPYLADIYNVTEKAYLIDHHQTFGVDLGWIHAPFETPPDYIPPASPVTTSQQGNVAPPLPIKG